MSWAVPEGADVKVVIIGNGTSGKSAMKMLKKLKFDVFLIDEKKVNFKST